MKLCISVHGDPHAMFYCHPTQNLQMCVPNFQMWECVCLNAHFLHSQHTCLCWKKWGWGHYQWHIHVGWGWNFSRVSLGIWCPLMQSFTAIQHQMWERMCPNLHFLCSNYYTCLCWKTGDKGTNNGIFRCLMGMKLYIGVHRDTIDMCAKFYHHLTPNVGMHLHKLPFFT